MKILLCGEGPHDIGRRNAWDERTRRFVDHDGWLQLLVRKAAAPVLDLVFDARTRGQLPSLSIRPRPRGHGEKAFLAMRTAKTEGCDLVVFMADADSPDPADHRSICADILEGFDAAGNPVPGLACVPMSAAESWLLADEAAWRRIGLTDPAVLPPDPERLWGRRDDPAGHHPKHRFARVCAFAGADDCSETRWVIAAHADPVRLTRRCPASFAPFWRGLDGHLGAGLTGP